VTKPSEICGCERSAIRLAALRRTVRPTFVATVDDRVCKPLEWLARRQSSVCCCGSSRQSSPDASTPCLPNCQRSCLRTDAMDERTCDCRSSGTRASRRGLVRSAAPTKRDGTLAEFVDAARACAIGFGVGCRTHRGRVHLSKSSIGQAQDGELELGRLCRCAPKSVRRVGVASSRLPQKGLKRAGQSAMGCGRHDESLSLCLVALGGLEHRPSAPILPRRIVNASQ